VLAVLVSLRNGGLSPGFRPTSNQCCSWGTNGIPEGAVVEAMGNGRERNTDARPVPELATPTLAMCVRRAAQGPISRTCTIEVLAPSLSETGPGVLRAPREAIERYQSWRPPVLVFDANVLF